MNSALESLATPPFNRTSLQRRSPDKPLDVIVADDEPADNLLLAMAAQDADVEMNFTFAEDGEELMRILTERVAGAKPPTSSSSTSACPAAPDSRRWN